MLRPHVSPILAFFVLAALTGGAAAHRELRPTAGAAPQDGGAAPLHAPVPYEDLLALRTFFERVDVTSVTEGIGAPGAVPTAGLGAVAARLPDDWEAPLHFVQGAVRYVPYAGSVRGADGTLAAGAGNALDQALLLRTLLQARGVPTRLVRGRLAWPDAARLVAGTVTPPAPQPDDPWPRWIETAADHWWVQAERDGTWVDLEPAFAGVAAGTAVGRSARPVDELPDELVTRVRVELLRGERVVLNETQPAALLVGSAVSLRLAAQSQTAVALWETAERTLAGQASWIDAVGTGFGVQTRLDAPRWQSIDAAARPGLPPRQPRPSAVRRVLLDPSAGPWNALLQLPGRTLEAGPFERADLDNLLVRVTVMAPQMPPHVLEAPWGGSPTGRLAIVVGAGAVGDEQLAGVATAAYRSLDRLATAEQAARVDMRPPVDYHTAADRLTTTARAEWERFAELGPEALAWTLLRALDRIGAASPAGRVLRPNLRLAAVRWHPPDRTREGSLEVRMSDPIAVGLLAGGSSAASLRAAHGVLQSAVFSQVLNRLTERAPDTAFDATLRAIGTGRALRPVIDAEALPAEWPPTARAEAAVALAAGYRVLAPLIGDGEAPGWWSISVGDGELIGWVPGAQRALHGSVELRTEGHFERLDALLASLPALHRALRWLSELPGSGPGTLASVPGAACASAAVAADNMGRSMPDGWPRPDVRGLCGEVR